MTLDALPAVQLTPFPNVTLYFTAYKMVSHYQALQVGLWLPGWNYRTRGRDCGGAVCGSVVLCCVSCWRDRDVR